MARDISIRENGVAKTVSTIVGIIFIAAGLLGFFAPHLLGLHLSTVHNVIHLVSGALALYFGLAGTLAGARAFCFVFGAIYFLLGLGGFLAGRPAVPSMPGMDMTTTDSYMLKILPGALELGTMDHILHIALGLIFIIAGIATRNVVKPATVYSYEKEDHRRSA